ncbi:hypothetical protein SCLCIDRAFT_1212178 [Scleroderma citrinum Foug A]|uniref:Uncharacterized protein n=1 Tax=Scleroderma citrinum Foug A TaxID=1036808 RepID=A0A0C3DY13_9AGAM|nr:hypothetical protein SCLCIDRAFT_1212178 [Scleroderma citrinum Foug A]
MRLINVEAFLARERLIIEEKRVDCQAKILKFCDDGATEYAILSHRWIEEQEVDCEEIVELAKMDVIRRRGGYQKILRSCEQAEKDGWKWLWVDTCCIDKRSSAELSEAINSMYRWYENAKVCYAYLHDVPDSSFPTARDLERYSKSNGWPEWFSRGWTLQEMIAPRDVQFFDKDWHFIGDKRTLAPALVDITRVPEDILTDGLSGDRPCVAQIMAWAADRTTTRVEDRAYSLMGLLDVNMPMLYGEGKKAFHRLQLEIIRTSNDQSIFAWSCNTENVQTGSILADSPSFFRDCSSMELMDHDEFIERFKDYIPEEELPSIEKDRFGVFPITNRGIQIWLLFCSFPGSHSVFQAWLPCRSGPSRPPVTINLALWKSDYYRYALPGFHPEGPLQFRQVYLRYQDAPMHRNATHKIDDGAITKNGFTYCGAYPLEFTGNALTLTSTNPLCVKVYSNSQANRRFAVGLGQCFGQDWIHVVSEEPGSPITWQPSWEDYARAEYEKMLFRTPEHVQSMDRARSGAERYGRVCVLQTRLPQSTWTVHTSCVVWKSSKMCEVKFEVFSYPGFGNVSGEWSGLDVDGADGPDCDNRGLMICDCPRKWQGNYWLLVDGISAKYSEASDGIKLGDYGYFSDSTRFCCEGNIFAHSESLSSKTNITPRQHVISQKGGSQRDSDYVNAWRDRHVGSATKLYKPFGLSLPSNDDFKSLLTSLSTRLTNRYLVTRVIQCLPDPCQPGSSITTPLCSIAKPFLWHLNEGAGSLSEERWGDELRAETKDQTGVITVDAMKL